MFRTRVLNTEGRMSHCVIYRCHTGCDTYVTPGNVTLWHKSAGLAETQMYQKQMTKEGSSCSRQDATSAADLLFSINRYADEYGDEDVHEDVGEDVGEDVDDMVTRMVTTASQR